VENGFDGAALFGLVENGFAEVEVEDGFVPNNVSPKFISDVEIGVSPSNCDLAFPFRLSFAATSVTLMPLRAFTLPSLRLHVFRRHVITYKRLSCPEKNSGRSPFNCRSKTMKSSHTLHFANVAEGGVVGSSQVWQEER
jgi:hypothetical protein